MLVLHQAVFRHCVDAAGVLTQMVLATSPQGCLTEKLNMV